MYTFFSDSFIKKTTVLLKCDNSIKKPKFRVVDASKDAEFVCINTKCKIKISTMYIILIMIHITCSRTVEKWPRFQLILPA